MDKRPGLYIHIISIDKDNENKTEYTPIIHDVSVLGTGKLGEFTLEKGA